MATASILSPAEVITVNKQPPPNHRPTCIRQAYSLYQFGKIGLRIASYISCPLLAAKATFETLAIPAARLTGSQTAEKIAKVAVNVLGICTDLPNWVVAKALHTTADAVTSCIPTSDHWIFRALKDVVEIAGTEAANYGARTITTNLNAAQRASAAKVERTEKAWQEYEKAQQQEMDLNAKAEQVDKMSKDPQWIADCAYNAASNASKHGNKDQIALELADITNAMSITQPDAARFSDSFITAQEGNPKRHNDNILTQLNLIVPAILAENNHALQAADLNTQQTREAYHNARAQETSWDFFFYSVGGYRYEQTDAAQAVQTLNLTLGNLQVEEVIETLYVKNEQAAEGAKNKKFALAFGIANDLMTMLGSNDNKTRDALFHRLLNAMDKSDRRWYNDVCGELHKILTGNETDIFTYKSHGLKKIWEKTTDPIIKILAWLDRHNGGAPLTVGAQVATDATLQATFNNKPVYTLYSPPQPQQPPIAMPTNTVTQNTTATTPTVPATITTDPQIYQPVSIAPFLSSVLAPPPPPMGLGSVNDVRTTRPETNNDTLPPVSIAPLLSPVLNPSLSSLPQVPFQATQMPTAAPSGYVQAPSTALDTAKDITTLGATALQATTGYGGLNKIGTTIDVLKEINQDYGASIKAWNISVECLLGQNPFVSAATASCDLYKNHVPQEKVQTLVQHLQNEALTLPNDAGMSLKMTAQFIQTIDGLFRSAADLGPSLHLSPEKVQEIYTMGVEAEQSFGAFVNQVIAEENNLFMQRELLDAQNNLRVANTLFYKIFC